MGLRTKIAVAVLTLAAGCQELPNYLVGDNTLARVGRTELLSRDVALAVPQGVTGDDSVAFVELYIDRWIKKQLKLREAEQLFSSSEKDIDRMVEEYRQSLLIRKLEQSYVDAQIDTLFTETNITEYYREHASDFRLDRTMVRGRVLQFPETYRQDKKLMELMSSTSSERQQDFCDVCVKNNFQLTDFGDTWVDFQEFLSYLPTLRSQSYDTALDSRGVQQMRDEHSRYYYRIQSVLRPGDPIPLELVRPHIRRILFNRRQNELIRAKEQALYEKAVAEQEFRIYDNKKTEK